MKTSPDPERSGRSSAPRSQAAVVAAAYYLRLIASIWFAPPAAQLQAPSGTVMVTALASAALTFPVLVLLLGALQGWAENAVRMSF